MEPVFPVKYREQKTRIRLDTRFWSSDLVLAAVHFPHTAYMVAGALLQRTEFVILHTSPLFRMCLCKLEQKLL